MYIGEGMKNFDFLVIGAMKSGTTTVHDILMADPRIALPLGKETPFFTDENKLSLGLEAFIKRYYPNTLEDRLIGKVSPQYMAWYKMASENIEKYSSDTKLIAVLRDPVDRLLSHYSMYVGMGFEKRNINQVIEDCLNMGILSEDKVTFTNSYIHWSCYGTILSRYIEEIPSASSNLLILSFNELIHDQVSFMTKVYRHIGLDFSDDNFEVVQSLSRGSDVPYLSRLLVYMPWLAKGIVKVIPHKYKDVVRMARIEAQISMYAPKVLRSELNQENVAGLQNVFERDKKKLSGLGFVPYWGEE